MKFKVIRQSKFNRKIEAFVESADSVIVSRLYDGVLVQIKDSTLYNVESGEVITNDLYKKPQQNLSKWLLIHHHIYLLQD